MPEAGSCANCPKRTGFNALLFSDVRKDSCTDPQCFRSKVDAHIAKAMEKKPELVQISSAWSSRHGAPLGCNRYVELKLRKTKTSNQTAKAAPAQKPCEKMTEAIVMDGGKRGQIVTVCADPDCRTHHGNRPSPQELECSKAEERKRIAREKLTITIRHRILATILERVAAPLKKADLLTIAQHNISHLQYNQATQLAKRHKVDVEKEASPEKQLNKRAALYDEAALCRLLLEVSLLDSAYHRPGKNTSAQGGHMSDLQRKPVTSVDPSSFEFEPLLDGEEAAALLKIHPKTLQKLARQGKVTAIQVGKLWRFRASALDE